jgi:hypothetical protein
VDLLLAKIKFYFGRLEEICIVIPLFNLLRRCSISTILLFYRKPVSSLGSITAIRYFYVILYCSIFQEDVVAGSINALN